MIRVTIYACRAPPPKLSITPSPPAYSLTRMFLCLVSTIRVVPVQDTELSIGAAMMWSSHRYRADNNFKVV